MTTQRHHRPSLRLLLAGAAAAFVGLLAAGCGGAIPSSQGGSTTVKMTQSKLGRFLVDESGHTLYLFGKDEPKESYCNGACASVWPPAETDGTPTAGAGVSQSRLGTIRRDDGDLQLTYAGHPLYYYAGDASRPGETYGEELDQFGSEWYVVSPTGKVVEESGGEQKGGGGGAGTNNNNNNYGGGGGGY